MGAELLEPASFADEQRMLRELPNGGMFQSGARAGNCVVVVAW